MIARAAAPLLDWHAGRRRHELGRVSRDGAAVQEAVLRRLVAAARDTEFGLAHGFSGIRSVAEYQERVPVRDYRHFRPLWQRALDGESGVTWPGRCRDWVKTSGTTSGDKVIPVTREALASHRKGGWDALLMATERVGARHLIGGPMLFLGGSTAARPAGAGSRVGDLSGLAVRRLPPGLRGLYSPGPAISAIPEWEERLEAVAALAAGQDLRLISGMPSWLVILLERVARARRASGRPIRHLGQCWPNLRVLIHGGVAFAPYASVLDAWSCSPLERVEVYPASEGFVAVQTEASGGLTLMLDYGIFYEFVPVEDLSSDVAEAAHGGRRRAEPLVCARDVDAGRPLVVRAGRHGAVHPARPAAPGDHRPHAPLRQCLRRERHRGGDRARAGRRLPPDRGGGGRVHGGAAAIRAPGSRGGATSGWSSSGSLRKSPRSSRASSTRR